MGDLRTSLSTNRFPVGNQFLGETGLNLLIALHKFGFVPRDGTPRDILVTVARLAQRLVSPREGPIPLRPAKVRRMASAVRASSSDGIVVRPLRRNRFTPDVSAFEINAIFGFVLPNTRGFNNLKFLFCVALLVSPYVSRSDGFGVPPSLTTTAAMQLLNFRNGRLFFQKAR
jgi:hypothetical protein